MGKNGKLLREQKAQKTVYTFTQQQLMEHDQFIVRQFQEKVNKTAVEKVREEWNKREQMFSQGDYIENMNLILEHLLALASRVLIEKFGWKAPTRNRNYNILKFGDYLVEEINMIVADEMQDIRRYVEETYQKYGIRFKREELDDRD